MVSESVRVADVFALKKIVYMRLFTTLDDCIMGRHIKILGLRDIAYYANDFGRTELTGNDLC